MLDLKRLLSGRTVFVTGADGFVGSHVCEKLLEAGAEVHALVEATSHATLQNLSHMSEKIIVVRGDITDPHSMRFIMKQLKGRAHDRPVIFHLAAQAHVGESWERPLSTLMTNTVGTFNVLQAIVDVGLEIHSFDYAGTSEEYGNNKALLSKKVLYLHEETPVNPTSIYATSKLAGDFLSMNFFHAYGLPVVITRMFNNYGPRQSPRYITGTIVSQALVRNKILLGNLAPRRDFCFVEDGALGHIHIALKGVPGEVYSYGYGRDISISDWANLIINVGEREGYWRPRQKHVVSTRTRFRPGKSDVLRLRVGYDKLHKLTGWVPRTTWEEGLKKTIRWYDQNRAAWFQNKDW